MTKKHFCMKCNRLLPSFMFRRIPVEWEYRKNERVHHCRWCSFFHPVRYTQTRTKTGMKKLEGYEPSLKQKLGEVFR